MSGDVLGKSRLRSLLEHFGDVQDPREQAKVRYPLSEVLFLVVSATIAGCDDYDEIADWGEAHLEFLRSFSEFHFGTPGEDWLRVLMNRIDPDLFQECFTAWASELRPDAADLIAIDGKTSRRTHDRSRGRRALHLVSAFATTQRLVLAQEAVDEKENECGRRPRHRGAARDRGCAHHHRRHRVQPSHRRRHHRPRRPLSAGGQGQSTEP